MANTVRDKKVIVTGGANGIGFQYCHQLLLNGAKAVAILDLPQSNGELAVSKLNKEFGTKRAFFFPSDVTKYEEFEDAFKKAIEALQGLDILINNAGIMNDAMWKKEIEINFTALVKSTLLGYDYMGKDKGGKGGIIVNVASIVGLLRMGIQPVYSATKHAVVAFTDSMKEHDKKTGITVRVMCPGVTDTALITDAQNKYLSFIDNDEAARQMLEFPRQPTVYVGKAMIELIENGANGAVWVSQNCEPPFEVQLPKYERIKL